MIPRLSQAVSGLDSNKYFIAIASLSFEFIALHFNAVSAYMEERTFELIFRFPKSELLTCPSFSLFAIVTPFKAPQDILQGDQVIF